MATGKNGLGIEKDCTAGIPTYTKPKMEVDEEIQYFTA
mgnify:FL=1